MSEKSAKSFLSLLKRSGIVPEDRLQKSLAALSAKAAGQKVNLDALTKHLIADEVITQWHYDKLITGKHKGFFLGKYKLLGHLGTGGMSSVYLAEHSITGHKRALKVLPRKKVEDRSYFDRFYREGRAAASLNDPNIVRVYDICSEGETHYMVMEYVEGRDLYQLVRDNGALGYEESLSYVAQAAKGLQHAHDKKLVHRDIKPANLLVSGETVKILDLGLALLTEDEESLTVLHNEKVMGTADYLSPEQAVNSHEVDHRADIYSLGCTLYYLLTSHPPFPEGTLAQRIAMHQSKEPAEITVDRPDCPPQIVELAKRMMKKNPDERFQNCIEVMDAIEVCRKQLASNLKTANVVGSGGSVSTAVSEGDSSSSKSSPGPHAPSAADIRTDEIAQRTTETPKTADPVIPTIEVGPKSSKSSPSQQTSAKNASKSQAKIKSRASSKNNAGIWFAVMIVLMFIILTLVVLFAIQLTSKRKKSSVSPFTDSSYQLVLKTGDKHLV